MNRRAELQANFHFQRADAANKAGRHEEAFQELLAAAELGHSDAFSNLGVLYEYGKGVARDAAKALEWYKKSAALGHTSGINNLANLLYRGAADAGIEPDRAEGMRLMRQVAELGVPGAMFNLGSWLGEDLENTESIVWLKRAAEKGSKEAMYNLGLCYENGRCGLPKSAVIAISWYLRAAEMGVPAGMYQMGLKYANGEGVAKNLAMAVSWLERAVKAGRADAVDDLLRVKELIAANSRAQPCGACGKPASNRCSGCFDQKYCSADCQREHWKEHKVVCKSKR